MSEVKWIKIMTDMFDDEKIDFIQSLPESDALLVMWVRLLTLAGKCNRGGYILLTESIPYTDDMLAHKFKKPLNTVRLALQTFIKLEMIEATDNGLLLTNWNKHQNIEGLDKIRLQTKERVANHRERQKLLSECNVTSNVTVTQCNETEEEEELELDKELDKDKNKKKTKLQGFNLIINNYTSNLDLKNTIINFIKMRKAIKATLTDNALILILNKLTKLALNDDDKINILEQSIMNGWKGIFPIKKEGAKINGYSEQNTSESKGKWAGYKPKESTTEPLTDAEIKELGLV